MGPLFKAMIDTCRHLFTNEDTCNGLSPFYVQGTSVNDVRSSRTWRAEEAWRGARLNDITDNEMPTVAMQCCWHFCHPIDNRGDDKFAIWKESNYSRGFIKIHTLIGRPQKLSLSKIHTLVGKHFLSMLAIKSVRSIINRFISKKWPVTFKLKALHLKIDYVKALIANNHVEACIAVGALQTFRMKWVKC